MAHLHIVTKAVDTLCLNSVECKCCKVEICCSPWPPSWNLRSRAFFHLNLIPKCGDFSNVWLATWWTFQMKTGRTRPNLDDELLAYAAVEWHAFEVERLGLRRNYSRPNTLPPRVETGYHPLQQVGHSINVWTAVGLNYFSGRSMHGTQSQTSDASISAALRHRLIQTPRNSDGIGPYLIKK